MMTESIADCTRCPAHLTRKNIVIQRDGEKPVTLFVGEAPGAMEDKLGQPFVGPSGKLLDEEISRIGIPPEHYAITNAVKCRPVTKKGYNRAPTPEEIEHCRPFLQRQLDAMKPKVIVAVGRVAERALKNMGIGSIYVLHPAAVLRSPELKATMQQQMDKVKKAYHTAIAPAERKATIWWWW